MAWTWDDVDRVAKERKRAQQQMRKAGRTDSNQIAIIKAFRQIGATVQVLSGVGQGTPDALVGYRGNNYLIEIKDGEKPPSARQLTADQRAWHAGWAGQVCVAYSIQDAVNKVISLAVPNKVVT